MSKPGKGTGNVIGELLGDWLRVTGTGTISLFKRRLAWLAGTSNIHLSRSEPGRWLRDLSDRGYLEVDWDNDRWSCTPLVLTRLPHADALAVLAGFVPIRMLDKLSATDVEFHIDHAAESPEAVIDRPPAIYIQYDDVSSLAVAADALGATYIHCSATQLAETLLKPCLGPKNAPPNKANETLAKFDPVRIRWVPAGPGGSSPGLYRWEGNARNNYLWYEDQVWRSCDLPTGVWTALERAGTSAVRWRPYPGNEVEPGTGQLFTDLGAPLPPLHRRCLTLCSGTTAHYSASARTATYANVPRSIAEKIWSTLGQRPHII
jgi:hypothetical protein